MSHVKRELKELVEMEDLADAINEKNEMEALALVARVDPLVSTSSLWNGDSGAPTFMGFAIQQNLPQVVDWVPLEQT